MTQEEQLLLSIWRKERGTKRQQNALRRIIKTHQEDRNYIVSRQMIAALTNLKRRL